MEILKAKDKVKLALTNSNRCRDNDEVLLSEIWREDLKSKGYDLKTLSVSELLVLLSDGKLTKFESIRRVRCLLQQHNVNLRGDLYYKRRQLQENVKKDLGYNTQTKLL